MGFVAQNVQRSIGWGEGAGAEGHRPRESFGPSIADQIASLARPAAVHPIKEEEEEELTGQDGDENHHRRAGTIELDEAGQVQVQRMKLNKSK